MSISQAFSIVKISTKDIKYICAHTEQLSNQYRQDLETNEKHPAYESMAGTMFLFIVSLLMLFDLPLCTFFLQTSEIPELSEQSRLKFKVNYH